FRPGRLRCRSLRSRRIVWVARIRSDLIVGLVKRNHHWDRIELCYRNWVPIRTTTATASTKTASVGRGSPELVRIVAGGPGDQRRSSERIVRVFRLNGTALVRQCQSGEAFVRQKVTCSSSVAACKKFIETWQRQIVRNKRSAGTFLNRDGPVVQKFGQSSVNSRALLST